MKKTEFYKNLSEFPQGGGLCSKIIEFLALYLQGVRGKTLLIGYYEPYLPYLNSLANLNYITVVEEAGQQVDLLIVFNYLEYINNIKDFFQTADDLLTEAGKILIIYSKNCDLRNYNLLHKPSNNISNIITGNKNYIKIKNYLSFFFKNLFLVNKIHNSARAYLFKITRLETLYSIPNSLFNKSSGSAKGNMFIESLMIQRFWPFPVACSTFNILELKRELILPICNYIPI